MMEAANNIVNRGFKDAGYTYVNTDDCWQNSTRYQRRMKSPQ